jgi:hypothetical protein
VKLPNGDRAVVELEKLVGYCLDPTHPRGRHKARVFAAVLGLSRDDAPAVRLVLLAGARNSEAAVAGQKDGFGVRFNLDLPVTGPRGTALVRSGWIVRAAEDFPRFTSCYVL